jgi:AcrR family transcriptional regulator
MGIAERKERDFRRRERDILQAALRLFDRDDWQLVTIERIAQEAEIGKGTVYLHFSSKEDICGRLALDFARPLLARLRAIEPGVPVVRKLAQAIRIFFDAHRSGHRYHRVVSYCEQGDFRRRIGEGNRAELARVDEEIAALIHAILQEGIAAEVFAARPIPVLLYGAQSTLVGAVRVLGGECLGAADPEEYIAEITRFVLAGLMYQDRVPEIEDPPEPVKVAGAAAAPRNAARRRAYQEPGGARVPAAAVAVRRARAARAPRREPT